MMMTGPFIVTHRVGDDQREEDARRLERAGHVGEAFQLREAPPSVLYREALATLGYVDLRRSVALRCALEDKPLEEVLDALRLDRRFSLPDGSVIDVEATNWPKLASMVQDGAYLPESQVLAAWNAEHGIGLEARA